MPWCDPCDLYVEPNAVDADHTCPTCHNKVDSTDVKTPNPTKVPWHFWLMVIALVAYLGWRLIQGAVALNNWL